MRISTKGRYALRFMLDLAVNNTGKAIPVKIVASRQDISEKYLEQIIPALTRAGFLKSVRGPQGGYCLAYPPEKYTVGMILRLTEGSLAPVHCVDNGCERAEECQTIYVWEELYKAINNVVDSITLEDLVNRSSQGGDYQI